MLRSDASRNSPPRHISALSSILRFTVLSAIGLGIGYALWYASEFGYFQHWTQLAEKPPDLPGYLGTAGERIPAVPPDRIISPCNFSMPEFSPLTSPPKHIVDCVQRLNVYPDGDVRVTYAIDGDGRIWEWTTGTSVYSGLYAFVSSTCSGLLIGIVFALLIEGLKLYADRRRTANR